MNLKRIAGVFSPGEILRREMETRGWSQTDLAEILGRPLQTVNQILMGKKTVTPATARELEQATGAEAAFWLALEAQYRLSLETRANDIVERRSKLFSRAPVAEMRRRGWIRDTRNVDELESEVLRVLRIASLDSPPTMRFAARKSSGYASVSPEQEAWCCRAYQLAEQLPNVPRFSHRRFVSAFSDLRALGISAESVRQLPDRLASLGIRFVAIEHLPRTKIDGATFWLNKSSPVIALSLRFNRIDYFLFTLFHELIHVLNGDALSVDTDIFTAAVGQSASERRANAEAAARLVPVAALNTFIGDGARRISKAEIIRFAAQIRIHPGVVLGQLQHRGIVGWTACRELLIPVRDSILEHTVHDGWERHEA